MMSKEKTPWSIVLLLVLMATGYAVQSILLLAGFTGILPAWAYPFLHGNFIHLLFNVLLIYQFGTAVHKGSSDLFILLLFTLAVLSGWYLHQVYRPDLLLLGSSSAMYAYMTVYVCRAPFIRTYFLGFIPMPNLVVPITCLVLEHIIASLSGANISIAAHLGGILIALPTYALYVLLQWVFVPSNNSQYE